MSEQVTHLQAVQEFHGRSYKNVLSRFSCIKHWIDSLRHEQVEPQVEPQGDGDNNLISHNATHNAALTEPRDGG